MKILFLTHYFPPEVNAPANRTYEHCREWVRLGHEVHVVTCTPSHPLGKPFEGYRRCWYRRETMDGIAVHRVWTYLAPNKGRVRRIVNYLSFVPTSLWRSLRLGRFDVVIATSPQFFCAVSGWLAGKFKKTPWVFELRDLWPDSIAAVGAVRSSFLLNVVEKLELHLYRKAAGVACVTRAFIDNLESRGVPREKCSFLPNGVVLEDWANLDGRGIRARYGVDANDTLVSYVGTVGMAHQIGVMVEAAELARKERAPLHFMVAGDGAELADLRRRAKDMALTNLTFLGLVPRDAARDILGASDVVVVHLKDSPLFRTVLPSKMFEAMAAGKPVVLGVKGEALDVLRRAGAGIAVAPGDSRALLDAALDLAQNEMQRNEMGKAGREFVEREYSRKVWAGMYLDWLKGVLSMPGAISEEVRC